MLLVVSTSCADNDDAEGNGGHHVDNSKLFIFFLLFGSFLSLEETAPPTVDVSYGR